MRKVIASVTSVVYHATGPHSVYEMLKENAIHLTTDLGTECDQLGKRKKFAPYFFSTSRIKYGGFSRSFSNKGNRANLVIDGNALNQKYHGGPVDYWGPSFRPPTAELHTRLRNNENEDRIYSPDPYLKPLSKYVKEIHVFISKVSNRLFIQNIASKDINEEEQALKDFKMYREMTELSAAHNIKIFFYTEFEPFKLLDKRKALKADRFLRRSSGDDLKSIVELFEAKVGAELSDPASTTAYHCKYDRNGDTKRRLLSEFHNAKSGTRAEKVLLDKVVLYMRKYKLRNIDDIIAYLGNKFKS